MRVFKNGTYFVADIWVKGKKHRFSSGLTDEREALKAAKEHRKTLTKRRKEQAGLSVSLRLNDVAVAYMENVGDLHAGADNTERLVNHLITHFGEHKLITEITHDDVLALRARRSKDKVQDGSRRISAYTVNDTIEQLKKLFTFCKGRGVVFNTNATPKWERKHKPSLWLAEPKEHVRELSVSEADRLDAAIAKCRPDYWPLIEFARTVVKRKMNCIELTWSQVKWERKIIELKGKGDPPKPVRIPITDAVREILWPLRGHHPERVFTYIAQRSSDKTIRGRRDVYVAGQRYPITKYGFKEVWKAIRKEAGLLDGADRFRFHDLRHDFASKAIRQAKDMSDIKAASAVLDHSDIEITLRTYAHLIDGQAADLIETMAKGRKRKPPKLKLA
jgi:integrase